MEMQFQNSFIATTVLVLVLFFINKVQGFPTGAPLSACSHLMPVHVDGELQEVASPYVLILNATTYGTDNIKLTVSAVGPSARDFMAFMLQARTEDGQPAGYFSDPPAASKTMTCYNNDDTLTHTAAFIRPAMEVIWHPPTQNVGKISITGSVAQSKIKYWAVESSQLTGTGTPTRTGGNGNGGGGGSSSVSVGVSSLVMMVMAVMGSIFYQ